MCFNETPGHWPRLCAIALVRCSPPPTCYLPRPYSIIGLAPIVLLAPSIGLFTLPIWQPVVTNNQHPSEPPLMAIAAVPGLLALTLLFCVLSPALRLPARSGSASVPRGRYLDIARVRHEALNEAFAAHPERFSRGRPLVKLPPREVAINPIPDNAEPSVAEQGVNFPTLQRAILKAI